MSGEKEWFEATVAVQLKVGIGFLAVMAVFDTEFYVDQTAMTRASHLFPVGSTSFVGYRRITSDEAEAINRKIQWGNLYAEKFGGDAS